MQGRILTDFIQIISKLCFIQKIMADFIVIVVDKHGHPLAETCFQRWICIDVDGTYRASVTNQCFQAMNKVVTEMAVRAVVNSQVHDRWLM